MDELISRQAAISAICNACGKIDCDKMDKCEKLQLPPANCSEFPNNSDTISRQAAIDAVASVTVIKSRGGRGNPIDEAVDSAKVIIADNIRQLPLIQPEIIRCKDCKYARLTNDGSCKYCDIWFPDEAEYMDGDYYCASAERRTTFAVGQRGEQNETY